MTLKAFHLVFIALSALLSIGFAAYCWRGYTTGGAAGPLALAVASSGAAVLLAAYGAFFVRRMRGLR